MLRQCCQCKRINENGRWVYPRLNQLDQSDISHGYCEDCFSKQMKRIRRSRRSHLNITTWFKDLLS